MRKKNIARSQHFCATSPVILHLDVVLSKKLEFYYFNLGEAAVSHSFFIHLQPGPHWNDTKGFLRESEWWCQWWSTQWRRPFRPRGAREGAKVKLARSQFESDNKKARRCFGSWLRFLVRILESEQLELIEFHLLMFLFCTLADVGEMNYRYSITSDESDIEHF